MSNTTETQKIRTIGAAIDGPYIDAVDYLRNLGYTDSVMVRRGLLLLYNRERAILASTKNQSEVATPQ